MSNTLKIISGGYSFDAVLEQEKAPLTCNVFRSLLPYTNKIVHVRWSGEAVWIPLGDLDLGLKYENHTSYPAPGHIIAYPGGVSETEILLAYGSVHFASKMGQLAGNHFITVTSNLSDFEKLGKKALMEGAQPISFALA